MVRSRTGIRADCQSWQWKISRDAQNFRGFEHGAGEQSEALGIVGIVAGRSAIEGIAIEVLRVLDEVESHAALAASAHDGGETVLVVEGDGDAANDRGGIGELGLAITRQVDADLMTQGSEGAGQGANDIGQSASLGKWNTFGSDECDVHECGTSRGAHDFRGARYYE